MINFRFLNIPVSIHPTFWIFLVFFVSGDLQIIQMIMYGSIFGLSLLIHEYGHGLTALYYGEKPSITLMVYGGLTSFLGHNISDKQRFLITLNGPLFESLLIFLPYFLLKTHVFQNYYIQYFLYVTMRLNILWCLLNIIPIQPLDGGYLLEYILKKFFGEKGVKLSLIIGNICAIVGCCVCFSLHYYFFSFLLFFYGLQNFQKSHRISAFFQKPNYFVLYNEAMQAMKKGEKEKAKNILKKMLKAKTNTMKISATETLAEILYGENRKKEAYNLLLKADQQSLKKGKCLLCKIAFEQKNYAMVEKYSREIYDIDPSFEIAVLNSKTYACLNDPELAAGWFNTASMFKESSKKTLKEILQDKMFDNVRNQESFKQYLDKV